MGSETLVVHCQSAGAAGSRTPLAHCNTAREQWVVGLLHSIATLLGSIAMGNGTPSVHCHIAGKE